MKLCSLVASPAGWIGRASSLLGCLLLGILPPPAPAQTSTARAAAGGKLHFDVRDFGAKGDGVTNDTPAINAAIARAAEQGGGVVDFPAGTYLLRRRAGAGQAASLVLRAGVSLDGHGCTLLLHDNCAYIGTVPDFTPRAYWEEDVTAGDRVVRVSTTEPFAVGDTVGIRLGDNTWDNLETKEMAFTVVSRVLDGQRLELKDPLPRSAAVKNTAQANRALIRFRPGQNPRYVGGFVRNFRLAHTPSGNAEAGIDLRCASDTLVEKISATDPGAGVVLLAYCNDILVRDIVCDQSVSGGHPSKGRVINAWNSTRCTFDGVEGHAFGGVFAFFESYCREIHCRNWRVVDDWRGHFQTARGADPLLMIVQDSDVRFSDLKVTGECEGQFLTESGGTPSRVEIDGFELAITGTLRSLPLRQISPRAVVIGERRFAGLGNFSWSAEVTPGSNGIASAPVPDGLWRRVTVEARGLSRPERVKVNGFAVTLSPTAPKVEIAPLATLGKAYPPNPPPGRQLKVEAVDVSQPLKLDLTVEYFLPVAARR